LKSIKVDHPLRVLTYVEQGNIAMKHGFAHNLKTKKYYYEKGRIEKWNCLRKEAF